MQLKMPSRARSIRSPVPFKIMIEALKKYFDGATSVEAVEYVEKKTGRKYKKGPVNCAVNISRWKARIHEEAEAGNQEVVKLCRDLGWVIDTPRRKKKKRKA